MNADERRLALEFTDPSGEALRLEWETDALRRLDPADPQQAPVWRLGGELDWDEIETVRVFSGRLDDERLISIAGLRPRDGTGHDHEVVAGALATPEELERFEQALVSTEYGADALPRRIGLELYRDHGALPLRIAGDATATAVSEEGGVRRVSTALALRTSGSAGLGVLDVLSRG